MRRREFITLVGGAAFAWPIGAHAESGRMRRIGALMGIAKDDPEAIAWVSAFRGELKALGWTEGRNVQMDFRWPSGDTAVMMAQAAELITLHPDVILTHATPATAAVQKVTRKIPNVFVVVNDPLGSGFIESIPRPGGNSTGFTNFESTVGSKWLELLKELTPAVTRVAMLYNPLTLPGGHNSTYTRSIDAAASSFGASIIASPFHDPDDIESAFAAFGRDRTGVIVLPDTSTTLHSRLIVEAAARHLVPALYPYQDFVNLGGLISYGVDRTDMYRRAASYVDRILRGTKPSELPVQAPVQYALVINLKAAKTLGLTVPPTLLVRADEVIE